MKNNSLYWVLGGGCVVNFAAHLWFYPSLPQVIPIHWGMDGTVNGWGPRYVSLLLAALPLLMLILMRVLPAADPKRQNYEKFSGIYRGFIIGITVFMAAVSWLTELSVFGLLPDGDNLVGNIIVGSVGLLFLLLGNYMPRIKQNYYMGCKTPWALADEHNWNRTNRMGGIVFVVMGLLMLVSCLFSGLLGTGGTMVLILGGIFGGTGWIYLYSFLVFKGIMK